MSDPRVLIVRFTAIGDCVMASWAASAIRERHSEAFLCWAVESRCAPMIDRSQLATRVEEIPRDRWKRARWSPKVWREQVMKYSALRSLRFDLGLDLQGYSKTALCLRLAKPKRRLAAYGKDVFASRLNPVAQGNPAEMHTVDWYGEVLKQVGDFRLPARPMMPHDPEAARSVAERLGTDRPIATITVSAGHPTKAYAAESWIEVAQGLTDRGFRVAFLGGPTDKPIVIPETVDFVGKLALGHTLEAVRLSTIHLSGDTGNGHMAAAVGVPTVSVFGPTNPTLFRPYGPVGRVLRNGESTDLVSPAEILEATKDLLGR